MTGAGGDRGAAPEQTGVPQVDYEARPPAAEDVIELFRAAGLNGPLDDPPRVQRMLDEAQFILAARVNGRLAGLIRVLTDFAYNAFIADLAVLPEYQRQGIGSALVRRATEPYRGVKFIVHPGHDSGAFWTRNGFTSAPSCMALMRRF